MNKDQVFWVVWGAVVAAAGGFYMFVVRDMQTDNEALLKKKRYLAARFIMVDPETKGIQACFAKTPEEKKKYGKRDAAHEAFTVKDYDAKLFRLYPLSSNLSKIPNPQLKKDKEDLDKKLREARADFEKKLFAEYGFAVNAAADFGSGNEPPADDRRFRIWVGEQDRKTDQLFAEIGKGISFEVLTDQSDLLSDNKRLDWLSDGRVTGWIRSGPGGVVHPEDQSVVLRRLVLRREILRALCATKAGIRRREPVRDKRGRISGEEVKVEERRIDRIKGLSFRTGRRLTSPRMPYLPHAVELEVSCHLGLVPALLRELESIGTTGRRPFTLWIDKCVVRRISGWPLTAGGTTDLNPEAQYGKENEWPVVVTVTGIIPEFDGKLDPQP